MHYHATIVCLYFLKVTLSTITLSTMTSTDYNIYVLRINSTMKNWEVTFLSIRMANCSCWYCNHVKDEIIKISTQHSLTICSEHMVILPWTFERVMGLGVLNCLISKEQSQKCEWKCIHLLQISSYWISSTLVTPSVIT